MKKSFLISVVIVATLGIFNAAFAQQTAKMSPKGTGFLQYLPQGYSTNTNKYPVVISLHGIKEKGNTLSEVTRVANVGLPKYVKYGQQYSFILISPQLKTTMGRWTGDYIIEVLNYVKTYLRIDPNRVYLTGLSLGGGGVWSVATAYPGVFAAILPICSGYNLTGSACNLTTSNVPVWGFHGDADGVVAESVTINMVNTINNCSTKPNPLAKYTIFPGLGHVIWDKVYKETTALSWMLSFVNGSTTSTTIPTTTNSAPNVNAGSNKLIVLPTNSTSITASASDSDGTIASYTWSKVSGPSASLSGTTTNKLSLSGLVSGSYVFRVTVKDNKGAVDTDDVTVNVTYAPKANAGTDRTITTSYTSLNLAGSATDTDGTISAYTWSKYSGPSVTMTNTSSKTLTISKVYAGTYVFKLTAKDNKGATGYDYVKVVVN